MTKKHEESVSEKVGKQIIEQLDAAYILADSYFQTQNTALPSFVEDNLSTEFINSLEHMAKYCEKAAGGYLNLVTSLSIKSALGDAVDIRYHQVQIQNLTTRPAGFNFRGVSEKIVYPWMEDHEFHGAKSGWQTRTFERPKPYGLEYDENIGYIKDQFLQCYYQVEENGQSATLALAFLMWRRIQLREANTIQLAIPRIQDVLQITNLFNRHFFYHYKDSKGASRLPVLALYAIYQVLVNELSRFNGKTIKPLESHSAADTQTGAIGDIEIVNPDGTPFEAVEVKHGIPITKAIVDSAKQKIRSCQVDRYYILTTHEMHEPSDEVVQDVETVKRLLGCQMIVNGVIPSIRYYLRLITNPGSVLPKYTTLLNSDKTIGFEHRDIWNKIATGTLDTLI